MSKDALPSTRLSLLIGLQDPRDNGAWAEFVSRYRPSITSWCIELGLREVDAEDVAQEILLKLVRVMQAFQYDQSQSYRAWLRAVTRNAVKDFLKGEQRRHAVPAGDTTIDRLLSLLPASDDGSQLSDALSRQMHEDLLREAQQHVHRRVDQQTWDAYHARYQDIPARQVASQLGMHVAAVHKAKSRVVRMIREEVAMLLSTHGQTATGEL